MSQTHFTRRLAPRASRGAGPKHPDALVLAQRYASEWAATERPEVVCDGDPHPGNVLRREAGWALIDPDGIVGERADDLGVVLRDACGEIVLTEASEPGSGGPRFCVGHVANSPTSRTPTRIVCGAGASWNASPLGCT